MAYQISFNGFSLMQLISHCLFSVGKPSFALIVTIYPFDKCWWNLRIA